MGKGKVHWILKEFWNEGFWDLRFCGQYLITLICMPHTVLPLAWSYEPKTKWRKNTIVFIVFLCPEWIKWIGSQKSKQLGLICFWFGFDLDIKSITYLFNSRLSFSAFFYPLSLLLLLLVFRPFSILNEMVLPEKIDLYYDSYMAIVIVVCRHHTIFPPSISNNSSEKNSTFSAFFLLHLKPTINFNLIHF